MTKVTRQVEITGTTVSQVQLPVSEGKWQLH